MGIRRPIAHLARSYFGNAPEPVQTELQAVSISGQALHKAFATDLVTTTDNFGHITWMGQPIWQNILDLWTMQEVISRVRPSLLIECGTFKGGSSRFFGDLFNLQAQGHCITIDVEAREFPKHERVTYLVGSTLDEVNVAQVAAAASAADGPVMVILDDDHSRDHVRKELDVYSPFVTVGSYLLVQDGVIDTLDMFASGRPGPLPAIHDFVSTHSDFVIESELSTRFLITHHPSGWLRRRS